MPGMPPPTNTEREAIIAYLIQQRDGLKYAAYGLSEEQIRMRPTSSSLSIGGLLKHAANTERSWRLTMLELPSGGDDESAYVDSFAVTEDDTAASLVAELEQGGAETTAAIESLDDLGKRVQLPKAPWFPENAAGFSARWILFHIIEELARHAGHADIIREHIDGATMYELMAGAEGWPQTDWLTPWRPADAPV